MPLLALTGISVSRVSRWTDRVIDGRTIVEVAVFEPEYRPVRLESSLEEFRDVAEVGISYSCDLAATLLLESA